jgi:galactokinase
VIEASALTSAFRRKYGREPRLFYGPGRVNLIGEHTDYGGGFVLPMAIDRGTWVAAAARDDRIVHAASPDHGVSGTIDLDGPATARTGGFLDYVQGVVRILQREAQTRLPGADVLVAGDVPLGAGLSSSASLEVALGWAMTSLAGLPVDPVALAKACQRAEHEFVGTMCGIMDPLIAALAREGHALLVDCRSLAHRAVPVGGRGASIVICDTGVKHALASSEYNLRRSECDECERLLAASSGAPRALRDLNVIDLAGAEAVLPEPLRRRCRHVVTENERTREAADCLERGDLEGFGVRMFSSHASLRDDYDVSCEELDVLVAIAASTPGVYGARMTGGGFGGCAIALVDDGAAARLEERLAQGYRERFGHVPRIFRSGACGGARELHSG